MNWMNSLEYQKVNLFYRFNALRFIAASLVLVHHAESLREQFQLVHFKSWDFFQNGANAVTFFFVLSGFLITYLLFKERKNDHTISIKRFYLKRIYRIWPLYFLMVLIGSIIQPQLIQIFGIDYQMPYTIGETWAYFVFFLPGLVTFYFGSHLLEPLWSIGVEELFYLIWAPIFKWFKRYIFVVFVAILVLKAMLLVYSQQGVFSPVTNYLIRILQFESMTIGAILAYVFFYYGTWLERLHFHTKILQTVLVIGTLFVVFFGYQLPGIWDTIIGSGTFASFFKSSLFGLLLLSFAMQRHPSKILDSRIMNYLGEISYGIYMYHLLMLTFLVEIPKLKLFHPALDTAIYYLLAFGSTILVAGLSKKYFENYFLRLKNK